MPRARLQGAGTGLRAADLFGMATVDEMPYGTIAGLLEVETGTVKSRVSRVRAKLRRIQESNSDVALAWVGRVPAPALIHHGQMLRPAAHC